MKIKKLLKQILFGLTLSFAAVNLSSCGFIEMGDSGTAISEIKTEVNKDGDTVVTIVYIDEEREPVVFIIPKGEDGFVGAGIKDIITTEPDSNGYITLIIYYTDDRDPSIIKVSTIKGEDGISIDSITPTYNSDGSITLTIKYVDNRLPEQTITIPAPNDGVGIASIKETNNDDGSKTLTIIYTNDVKQDVFIPAPEKGETGNGILYMVASERDTKYIITVYYTNGTNVELEFDKPTKPNTWHSDYYDPTTKTVPNSENGDFYLNKTTMTVYQKVGGKWVEIATLQESKIDHTVKFDANGGIFATNSIPEETIKHGSTFYSAGLEFPTVYSLDGREFLGWYTSRNASNVNSGQFTDLTPVLSDMTLYARWSE